MTIATDIDEVLADTSSAFIAFYNANFRTSLSRANLKSHDWRESLGIAFDEFVLRLHKFVDEGGFEKVSPIMGAREGVKALCRDHKLLAITSRPRVLSDTTSLWLERYFPGCFREIYYTKELIGEKNRVSKATFCLQEGTELFIDDAYEYAAGCAARGIATLLYDSPWNKNAELTSNMTRVFSWKDILASVADFAAKAAAPVKTNYYDDRIKI